MSEYREISKFTEREEIANALSHFTGFLFAIVATVLIVRRSLFQEDQIKTLSSLIFGISMMILYLSSSLTHFLKQGRFKNIFFSLDKIGIYMLIAGTYAPFALVSIKGTMGWSIFGIEWAGALVGSFLVLRNPVKFEKGVNIIVVISYVVMGWLILIAAKNLIASLPTPGWMLILIGGLLYSIGIFFYKKGKFKYHHLVWHLFVLAGTISHFLSIYYYVLTS